MEIKWPRIKLIRPQHVDYVTDDLIRSCLKWGFFLGLWKAWELLQLLKPLIEGIKKLYN